MKFFYVFILLLLSTSLIAQESKEKEKGYSRIQVGTMYSFDSERGFGKSIEFEKKLNTKIGIVYRGSALIRDATKYWLLQNRDASGNINEYKLGVGLVFAPKGIENSGFSATLLPTVTLYDTNYVVRYENESFETKEHQLSVGAQLLLGYKYNLSDKLDISLKVGGEYENNPNFFTTRGSNIAKTGMIGLGFKF